MNRESRKHFVECRHHDQNEYVEADVADFKVPSWNLCGGTEESREQPLVSASLSNFELGKRGGVTGQDEEGRLVICSPCNIHCLLVI
jgi:hypothetical protein